MASIQERLFKLQELVEEARRRQHEAQGALKNLRAQLKEKHGVETLEQAQALMEKTTQEINELNKRIDVRMRRLEEVVCGSRTTSVE